MINFQKIALFTLLIIGFLGCKEKNQKTDLKKATAKEILKEKPEEINTPEGMVWIPGGRFIQGARPGDKMAMDHEKPTHGVIVDGFFMDKTEVTNAEFKKFVDETNYVTVAERELDWEEIKKQLPPGTPKPADSILQPGSLIFKKTKESVPNLYDYSQWWVWKIGANWKHPHGMGSDIEGKDNYPVVHVAFEDAQAYCDWAGKRLPTEAEWEYAARAGNPDAYFTWGNDENQLSNMANTWEGEFPTTNTRDDGFEGLAPVRSYPENGYGLYDMAGNVWEFTKDWYNVDYYSEQKNKGVIRDPLGAETAYNPNSPRIKEKVIKGGSFLCNAAYCASFRISARMGNSLDSSHEHLGFRTVAKPKMLEKFK
jgi:formylglycine-generating enzyme required for sulfatase activity